MSDKLALCLIAIPLVLAGPTACGGDDAADPDATPIALFDATPPDAPQPDAFVCSLTECGSECVDLDTDPNHCGSCDNDCPPAADCEAPACVCPENFVPMTASFLFSQMDTTMAAPDVAGFGAFAGTDGNVHALLVLSNPDTVAVGTDIDLSMVAGSPAFGLGYEATTTSVRAGYLAVSGTLNLSRSCDAGVAGTVTGATLVEVDFGTFAPIDGGCTLTGVTTSFDIGAACDVGPDAGIADAGPPDAP